MNEESIQAAREAFNRDPETACQALLGCSAEEMFVTALRGCNQHKHKPGCPDANGGGVNSGDFERILKSYEAKSPEARKQEREAQLKRTLRDYEHAVGESASDSEVEKLWKDHTDTEALYNSLDERLAKKERGRGSDKSWDDKQKKQFAASVFERSDSIYNDLHRAWQNKGTDFLRKAGINIGDASAAYSRARGAARFIMNNPSSDRWNEALKDMQKNVSELEEMYKDLKRTKD